MRDVEQGQGAREFDGGPPMLRSRERIWGKEGLTPRQVLQIEIGNDLLRAALTMAATMIMCHGVAIIEHPALWEPTEVTISIWRLRHVLALAAAPWAHASSGSIAPRRGILGRPLATLGPLCSAAWDPSPRAASGPSSHIEWEGQPEGNSEGAMEIPAVVGKFAMEILSVLWTL